MSSERRYEADVVVIGGGIAGIVTALELLDCGRSVLLLDRDREEHFGGLAKESFGGIFMVDTPEQRRLGIRDSAALALADWHSTAHFSDDDRWPKEWAEAFVNHSLEKVYHWLRDRGVRFFPVVHWVERGLYGDGNSVPRFHMVWGTGHRLVEVLVNRLRQHRNAASLQLAFDHRVRELVSSNGRVVGCAGTMETGGGDFSATAGAVVVATGGICGALERVRKHWNREWGAPPPVLLNGAHRFGDGGLHDCAAGLGARLTHLDRQWHYAAGVHHPDPDRPAHGLSLVPPKSALWVDATGRRIGPMPLITGYDTRFLVERVCAQPGQYSWQVMNWKIAVKELAVSGSEFNNAIRDRKLLSFLKSVLLGNPGLVRELSTRCEDFVVADSLPELVEKMNALSLDQRVDGAQLTAEVEAFDRAIARSGKFMNDEQLRRIAHARRYRGDRVRTCKAQPILDPKARPLLAIREFILARKSLGGIQNDLQGRVLDGEGEAIPGLYAVGEAAGFGGGGIHGQGALEGTFLGSCVLGGQLAAAAIADRGSI